MPLCTLSFFVVTLQCIRLLRGHLLAGKLYFERLLFCRELFFVPSARYHPLCFWPSEICCMFLLPLIFL
uniref:Putative secreted protein n=1 Tax=Ixodes ricinus TaxID=34613 RepID=A0A6B0TZI5_IXORI